MENRSPDYVAGPDPRRASSSPPRSTCSRRSGWASGSRARATSTAASTCSGPASGTTSTSSTYVGRSVWVYGQTEVTKDLMAARDARPASRRYYEVSDVALHDLDTDRPSVTFTDARRRRAARRGRRGRRLRRLPRPSRAAPSRTAVRRTWERTYPYAWLGILADVAPVDRRADLRLAPGRLRAALDAVGRRSRGSTCRCRPTRTSREWSDDRIWDGARHPARRTARTAGRCSTGPITEKSVLPMRSFVADADAARPAVPGRRRRAHRAADRRQGAQPRDRRRRPAGPRADRAAASTGRPTLADAYSDDALRRVWRCTHFSWWMTSMLHTSRRRRSTRSSSSPSCGG